MISPEEQADRDWQAYRYLANEMSVEESERFEAQLAEDQQAREALADAMELSLALEMLRPQESPLVEPARRRRTASVGWLVAGTALCLLIGTSIYYHFARTDDAAAMDELARAWTDTVLAVQFDADQDAAAMLELAANEWEATDELLTGIGDEEVELQVPSWMLAAVRSDAVRSDTESLEAENDL